VTNEDENDAQDPVDLHSETMQEARRFGQGPGRPPSKKQRILAWLSDRGWDAVSEERAHELARAFPDCSDDTLRTTLLDSGLPLARLVEGVVQDNYRHLEASLAALLAEYQAARESDDNPRIQVIRAAVIRAKQHAEFAANNPKVLERKRRVKAEMALWLHNWLENPPLFPAWVELRKRRIPGFTPESQDDPQKDPE
jgi:hypothetical protein